MLKTNFKNTGLALLRIGASAMLLTHGIPKLSMLFADKIEFSDPLGIGALPSLLLALLGEFIAPIFIIIGYKTRLFAVPAAITMFVAALIVHMDDPFSRKEKALLFALCFVVIFLMGPGKYSIDRN